MVLKGQQVTDKTKYWQDSAHILLHFKGYGDSVDDARVYAYPGWPTGGDPPSTAFETRVAKFGFLSELIKLATNPIGGKSYILSTADIGLGDLYQEYLSQDFISSEEIPSPYADAGKTYHQVLVDRANEFVRFYPGQNVTPATPFEVQAAGEFPDGYATKQQVTLDPEASKQYNCDGSCNFQTNHAVAININALRNILIDMGAITYVQAPPVEGQPADNNDQVGEEFDVIAVQKKLLEEQKTKQEKCADLFDQGASSIEIQKCLIESQKNVNPTGNASSSPANAVAAGLPADSESVPSIHPFTTTSPEAEPDNKLIFFDSTHHVIIDTELREKGSSKGASISPLPRGSLLKVVEQNVGNKSKFHKVLVLDSSQGSAINKEGFVGVNTVLVLSSEPPPLLSAEFDSLNELATNFVKTVNADATDWMKLTPCQCRLVANEENPNLSEYQVTIGTPFDGTEESPLEGAFSNEIAAAFEKKKKDDAVAASEAAAAASSEPTAAVDNKEGGVAGNVYFDHGLFGDSDAANNADSEQEPDYYPAQEGAHGPGADLDFYPAQEGAHGPGAEAYLASQEEGWTTEDGYEGSGGYTMAEEGTGYDAGPQMSMDVPVEEKKKKKKSKKKKPIVVDPVKGKYEDNKILNQARRRGIESLLNFYGKVNNQETVDKLFGAFQFARIVKYNIDVTTPEGKMFALVSIPARFFDLIESNHPFLKSPPKQTEGSILQKATLIQPKLIFPKKIPYVLNITYGELYESLTTARQAFVHYQVEMMKSGVEAITKGYSGPLVLASTQEPSEYSRLEQWWTSFRQFLKHNAPLYKPQDLPEECDETALDPSDPSDDDNLEIAFDENFKVLYITYNNFPMTAGLDCFNSEFGFKHPRTNNYVHLIKQVITSRLEKTWTDWVLTYTYPIPEIVPASKKTPKEKQQENAEKTIQASSISSVKTASELEKENIALSNPEFKLGVSSKTKTEQVSVMDPVMETLPDISDRLSDTNVAYQYLLNKIGTDKMVAAVLKCAYQGLVTIEDLAAQFGIAALAEEAKTDSEKKKVLLGLLAELPEPCIIKVLKAAFEIEKKDKTISIMPIDSPDTEETLSSIENLEECKEKNLLGQEVIIKPTYKKVKTQSQKEKECEALVEQGASVIEVQKCLVEAEKLAGASGGPPKHTYLEPFSKGNNVVIWQNALVSLKNEFEEIDEKTGEKVKNQGSGVDDPPEFAIDGLYGSRTMAGTVKLLGKNSVSRTDFEKYAGIAQNEQLIETSKDDEVYIKPYYGYKFPPQPPAKPEFKNVIKVWQECLNTFDKEIIGELLKIDGLFGEKTALATKAVLNKDTAEVTYGEFKTTCACLKEEEPPPPEDPPPPPPDKFYCKPDGSAPSCEEIYGEFEKQIVKMARMQREGEDITEQKKKVLAYENQYIMCMEAEQGLAPVPGDPTHEELIEKMAQNSADADPECDALQKAYIDSLGGFVVTTGSLDGETVYEVSAPQWPGEAKATQEQKEAKSNWELCLQGKKAEKIITLQASFEKTGILLDKEEYPYPFTYEEAASIIKTYGGGTAGTSKENSVKLNGVIQVLKIKNPDVIYPTIVQNCNELIGVVIRYLSKHIPPSVLKLIESLLGVANKSPGWTQYQQILTIDVDTDKEIKKFKDFLDDPDKGYTNNLYKSAKASVENVVLGMVDTVVKELEAACQEPGENETPGELSMADAFAPADVAGYGGDSPQDTNSANIALETNKLIENYGLPVQSPLSQPGHSQEDSDVSFLEILAAVSTILTPSQICVLLYGNANTMLANTVRDFLNREFACYVEPITRNNDVLKEFFRNLGKILRNHSKFQYCFTTRTLEPPSGIMIDPQACHETEQYQKKRDLLTKRGLTHDQADKLINDRKIDSLMRMSKLSKFATNPNQPFVEAKTSTQANKIASVNEQFGEMLDTIFGSVETSYNSEIGYFVFSLIHNDAPSKEEQKITEEMFKELNNAKDTDQAYEAVNNMITSIKGSDDHKKLDKKAEVFGKYMELKETPDGPNDFENKNKISDISKDMSEAFDDIIAKRYFDALSSPDTIKYSPGANAFSFSIDGVPHLSYTMPEIPKVRDSYSIISKQGGTKKVYRNTRKISKSIRDYLQEKKFIPKGQDSPQAEYFKNHIKGMIKGSFTNDTLSNVWGGKEKIIDFMAKAAFTNMTETCMHSVFSNAAESPYFLKSNMQALDLNPHAHDTNDRIGIPYTLQNQSTKDIGLLNLSQLKDEIKNEFANNEEYGEITEGGVQTPVGKLLARGILKITCRAYIVENLLNCLFALSVYNYEDFISDRFAKKFLFEVMLTSLAQKNMLDVSKQAAMNEVARRKKAGERITARSGRECLEFVFREQFDHVAENVMIVLKSQDQTVEEFIMRELIFQEPVDVLDVGVPGMLQQKNDLRFIECGQDGKAHIPAYESVQQPSGMFMDVLVRNDYPSTNTVLEVSMDGTNKMVSKERTRFRRKVLNVDSIPKYVKEKMKDKLDAIAITPSMVTVHDVLSSTGGFILEPYIKIQKGSDIKYEKYNAGLASTLPDFPQEYLGYTNIDGWSDFLSNLKITGESNSKGDQAALTKPFNNYFKKSRFGLRLTYVFPSFKNMDKIQKGTMKAYLSTLLDAVKNENGLGKKGKRIFSTWERELDYISELNQVKFGKGTGEEFLTLSVPLIEVEQDFAISDTKSLKEVCEMDLKSVFYGDYYDSLREKLKKHKEFKTLFSFVLPVQRHMSLLMAYSVIFLKKQLNTGLMLGGTKAACDTVLSQIDTDNHSNYKTPIQQDSTQGGVGGSAGVVKYGEKGTAGIPTSAGTPSFSGITGVDVFAGYGSGAGTDFISTCSDFIVDEAAGSLESIYGLRNSIDFENFSLPDDLEAELGLEGINFDTIEQDVTNITNGITKGINNLTSADFGGQIGGIVNDFIPATNPFLPMKLKILARAPFLIIKGMVEVTDPNMMLTKKIYDATVFAQQIAKMANPELPVIKPPFPLISLALLPVNIPFGLGFPPPPFGPGIGPPMTPLAIPIYGFWRV